MNAAGLAAKTEKSVTNPSAGKIWEKAARNMIAMHLGQKADICFQKQ